MRHFTENLFRYFKKLTPSSYILKSHSLKFNTFDSFMNHPQLVHCDQKCLSLAPSIHIIIVRSHKTRESGALESHSYYHQQIDGDRDQNKPVRGSFLSALSQSAPIFTEASSSSSAYEPVRNRSQTHKKLLEWMTRENVCYNSGAHECVAQTQLWYMNWFILMFSLPFGKSITRTATSFSPSLFMVHFKVTLKQCPQ